MNSMRRSIRFRGQSQKDSIAKIQKELRRNDDDTVHVRVLG